MSKKSRRRNKKILGALGALGALALMGRRGTTTGADVDSGRGSGLRPTVDDKPKKSKKVYQDAIMRGGKGVKAAKVGGFPRLKVTDRGDVIRDGVNTGVGNKKTKFVGGDGKIFQGGVQVGEAGKTSPGISVRDDGSIMAKGVLYPNRTAYMNRGKLPANLTKGMGMDRVEGVNIPDENFKTSEFDYFAKGGRVKKKPFAKRGFGRAYKKGGK
tara:strand:+ start:22 stop:660 length:639 start_codon:yes stop_codon:yes gene_type:complete